MLHGTSFPPKHRSPFVKWKTSSVVIRGNILLYAATAPHTLFHILPYPTNPIQSSYEKPIIYETTKRFFFVDSTFARKWSTLFPFEWFEVESVARPDILIAVYLSGRIRAYTWDRVLSHMVTVWERKTKIYILSVGHLEMLEIVLGLITGLMYPEYRIVYIT